ncbi:MAG TPA: protein kinase [Rhodocyclaceae bacterium]|nr:protein kinase [Rhodocyclaceae bacterium]
MDAHPNTVNLGPGGGPRVAHALKPGAGILEYQIQATLGGGGFGITYLARDANLDLSVAIKEYLPADLATRVPDGSVQSLGDATDDQFRWGLERFLDEARALAAFRHPNIVRVLRYFPANGTAYIVMEYESGESLKRWMPHRGPLDRMELLRIVNPLLDGLEMIHKGGFLHRDIKPDNIYIRADGSPVLIDFGAARRTASGRDLTSIVSPGFAPFEQYHSQGNQGPWTDLYSLAAVMYWLVSGEKPVEAAARLKNDGMIPAVRLDRRGLVGDTLLAAIDWALSPDETKRPQSVAEFRTRIREADGRDRSVIAGDSQNTRTFAWGGGPDRSVTMAAAGLADSHRRNMVCTVLFLDIVAYSKASVNEQYELKSAFNQLIAGKLAHVPDPERITLDTGDGAAICFLGDPEEVLHAAVDIRRGLAAQERLKVRMGLHIGPVRVLNDLNGRGNVIGDGINVAQRVMSFAEANGLLVSRAFYDVVACLSDGGERAFRHLGEHRDKHDRAHDLYAVLADAEDPGLADRTIPLGEPSAAPPLADGLDPEALAGMEKELARYLGPLAPLLVRKARGRAADAAELREMLAQSISDPAHREAFRKALEVKADNASSRSRPVDGSTADARSFPPAHSKPSTPVASIPLSGPVATAGPWLSAEAIAMLEKSLARAIGPMARLLVKNEAKKAGNLPDLCESLAAHVDNPELRDRFRKDVASLGKG